jgi:oligopeptide/dipeptide ABC transporter ATP-binding protein
MGASVASPLEEGAIDALFQAAAHPYTRALIAAMPKPTPGRRRERAKGGGAPLRAAAPAGCPYAERCEFVKARCLAESPKLRPVADGRAAACHFAEEVMEMPRLV